MWFDICYFFLMKLIELFCAIFILSFASSGLAQEVPLIQFKDVAPIFEKRCSGCHADASGGSVNWSDYKTVFEMREQIYLKVVTLKNMPLYSKMPQEERDLIMFWIDQGAQE